MTINSDMNKISYIPPRAECFFPQVHSSLLTRLSMRELDAEFADPLEYGEWGDL